MQGASWLKSRRKSCKILKQANTRYRENLKQMVSFSGMAYDSAVVCQYMTFADRIFAQSVSLCHDNPFMRHWFCYRSL